MKYIFTSIVICLISVISYGQDWTQKLNQPIELGQVHWLRDYEEALQQSQAKDLPVFMFFQEVPGCHTCSTFGNKVMSHPLIVEAIETHFIPLIIYNNKGGDDGDILKKYNEPAWNNPVVRIINSKGKDIVNRHAGAYDPSAIINIIQNALLASNQITPNYINLLQKELTNSTEEAVLSMYCFWTGEKEIGSMPGVQSTQAGYMNGTEVVKVHYDPSQITYAELISESSQKRCADKVYTDNKLEKIIAEENDIPSKKTSSFRIDRQDKYYLSQTDYQSIPMLKIQATKANALIAQRQSPNDLLSPRQISILELVVTKKIKKENRAKGDFLIEWNKISK